METAEKTGVCPKCKSVMVKRQSNVVIDTSPPIYTWYYWCACGHREKGGTYTHDEETEGQEALRRWKKANE